MPVRTITVDGRIWRVTSAGRITQYDRDEFGLIFETGEGAAREHRVTRYSPQAARRREMALAQLSDADLARLLRESQPGATSPEVGYTR